jgi:hypothetical protein
MDASGRRRSGGVLGNEATPAELASFTSWKLNMLDAMNCDPKVTDADFRVAFRLMQHVNSTSRLAWPSMDWLACQIGKSGLRVRAAIKNLSDAGWLAKHRLNRHRSNEYAFHDAPLNTVLDAKLTREDAYKDVRANRAETRFDRSDSSARNGLDRSDSSGLDRLKMPGPDRSDSSGKHLKRNYLQATPSNLGVEEEDSPSPYALAKGRVA